MTHKRDDASFQFLRLLTVTIVFCVIDAFWGLLTTGLFPDGKHALYIISMLFHALCGYNAWAWFRYIQYYINPNKKFKGISFVLWHIPLFLILTVILVNTVYPVIFAVSEKGSYITLGGRIGLYFLDCLYFILGLCVMVYQRLMTHDVLKRQRYTTVMIFAVIPIITTVVQYLTPYSPAYAVGLMFSCLVIFIFNTTAENELYTVLLHEAENLEKISLYEHQLKNTFENQIYYKILQKQGAGVVATDMQDTIVFINDAAARMYGWENAEKFDGTAEELIRRSDSPCQEGIITRINELKKTGGKLSYEISTHNREHKLKNILVETHVVDILEGNRLAIFCLADITNNKLLEKELLHLSETDPLTGIANRRNGEQRTELLMLSGKSGMFCILDCDRFKHINDSFGHTVGDKVLVALASCLKHAFRELDIIMRMGGDEFSVFAVNVDDIEKGRICIERLFAEIDRCSIPELNGEHFTVSLGAVICKESQNKTVDEYFQMADNAMYVSKKYEGNHYEFFDVDSTLTEL